MSTLITYWVGEYRNAHGQWVLICSLPTREEAVRYVDNYVRANPHLGCALNVWRP